MLIEEVAPEVVESKDSLLNCLTEEMRRWGLDNPEIDKILSYLPVGFLATECFLDKLTNLWRYEIGRPSYLPSTNKYLWPTNEMWPLITLLSRVLFCAYCRLSKNKLKAYIEKLTGIKKHSDSLVEMIPLFRMNKSIAVNFEMLGYGAGNKTVDWVIGPVGKRLVLLDVKNRMKDLYQMTDQDHPQTPVHDPALLFSSIEDKLVSADPNEKLQGIWVVTQVKQEHTQLHNAFNALDNTKIHYAILGDELEDAYIITQRPEDEAFLRAIFQLKPSERFTYRAEG